MSTTQSFDRIEFAEKEVVRYKEDLDDWKQKHDRVVNYWWPIEDLVRKAVYLFELITHLGDSLRRRRMEGHEELLPEAYVRNRVLLKEWLSSSLRTLTAVELVEAEYGEVPGAAKFRGFIEEAKSRTDSPRPVKIDDHGKIFEMNGERVIMSGLEPEEVLKGLEDERMGRTRSLKEIIAERAEHGI